ncbi:Dak1 domain-containing protein [Lipomyces orientalis]|uniref:Dak1 domain-containing protein n=1 Tax=Lipomyces orientalis TaxID=1233043 RepID=A0ACC3TJK9_9ASCO
MSSSKHVTYKDDLVLTYLRGLAGFNPTLKVIESDRIVYRSVKEDASVTVLSGGGSGHEPAHAGFVGKGMLDVAVAGSIFASPSTRQILAGIKAKSSETGTLIIVKNYTGDILHFGLAAERAKAQGIPVEVVIVGDDVAVGRTKGGLVGRRGLAGTVLVHKVAGAEAALGSPLKKVAASAQAIVDNLVTVGASLDHCSVPGRESEPAYLDANELEVGMGIHNEPGIAHVSPLPSADGLVESLLSYLLSESDTERSYVKFEKSDDVVLLLNNLGGTSMLEVTAISHLVLAQLRFKYGILPVRVYVGTFMTSLNAPGFSITLLNASKAGGYRILELLDAETDAPGWNAHFTPSAWTSKGDQIITDVTQKKASSPSKLKSSKKLFAAILAKGAYSVLEKVPEITRYDTVAGDGDCGETLASGANAILSALKSDNSDVLNLGDGVKALTDIAEIIENSMGGTSGGIYSIYISALAQGLRTLCEESAEESVVLDLPILAKASKLALNTLYKYTKARIGDRTLIDALAPFVGALESGASIIDATDKAAEGAHTTRKLQPRFGRASYIGQDELAQFDAEGGLPDPGAVGVAALLEGFAEAYSAAGENRED